MKMNKSTWLTVSMLLLVLDVAAPLRCEDRTSAEGHQGAVAAGREVAVAAGMEQLQAGGNAIDAAVATVLTQCVVESQSVCFGGEVPLMVYDAKRQSVDVYAGQGAAPALATVDWFQKNKGGKILRNDASAATVPAVLHSCLTALQRSGSRTFAQVSAPMLRCLDSDEPAWRASLRRHLHDAIGEEQKSSDRQQGLQAVLDYFYRGAPARQLDAWSRDNGGLLRRDDLAKHSTDVESPVSISYRGYTIAKCGAWTQGPALLQTLRLLETYDLRAMGHNSAEYIHRLTEAMKLAFADRDTFYADTRVVDVPIKELLSDDYTSRRRTLIDPQLASLVLRPGDPRGGRELLGREPQAYQLPSPPARDTTTCLAADRWGNVVAATPSGWSGVLAGNSGIVLGSRLISLNLWPGHPNCLAPGKRPRITLTPTLVLKDGRPVLAISVAGGDLQDQTTLQVLLNYVEFGMSPVESVTAPRFSTQHHVGSFNQDPPMLGNLNLQDAIAESVASELSRRGHVVRQVKGPIGHPIAIELNSSGRMRAAGDPQARRHADAF